MNGFKMRNDEELDALMTEISNLGVELLDFTIYGTREYHDRFAARQGDFDYVLRMIKAAKYSHC